VPAVDGNPGRLEQVFLNLLLNASQAFPDDSEEADNLIRVSLRAEGDQVVAEVSDNGPGIPSDLLGRIFDPFFTTKPVGVGTGLGLPICRGIVQTHGGEITVDSKPGAGAVFTLSFPASKLSPIMPSRKSDRSPQEAGNHHERGRVLVVDDESVVAHTLKVLLQGEHDLVIAESGAEALELLHGEAGNDPAYDVILCDLMMPSMTGMELFEVLRREYPTLASRVVFMTGGVSMLRVSEFLESVPNAKFEKPFDIAELRRCLHRLVATSRGQQPSVPPQARA
jgi:two-component system cell cycle sensor histidine kinase/response regulator CckA